MKQIRETICLLHSMILSGEKTDGTATKMVSQSIKRIDELTLPHPAPAENNRQITKMFICEIPKLILHPNQLYEFMVAEDCQDCKDYFGKDPAPAVCEFDSADGCGAMACYNSQIKCNSRDNKGNPIYKEVK
jgi:hypothetical protein